MMPRVSSLIDRFFDEPLITSPFNGEDFFPATNIEEMEDSYLLTMAVPGLKSEDINVEVDKNLLTISYEKESENETSDKLFRRKEYSFDSFKRTFLLPENVSEDDIEASCASGELSVRISKKTLEPTNVKSIPVN